MERMEGRKRGGGGGGRGGGGLGGRGLPSKTDPEGKECGIVRIRIAMYYSEWQGLLEGYKHHTSLCS